MSRKSKQNVDTRIATLHRAKKTHRQIATVLRREGHEISPSGVTRALARLGLAGSPRGAAARPAAPAVAGEQVPAGEQDGELVAASDDDIRARVLRTLDSLERAADQAAADCDVQQLVAVQRAITSATQLLSKVTPAPPLDPNDAPDMVALRTEAARRWHEMVDMVTDADEAP
jgi:hypothetical protein